MTGDYAALPPSQGAVIARTARSFASIGAAGLHSASERAIRRIPRLISWRRFAFAIDSWYAARCGELVVQLGQRTRSRARATHGAKVPPRSGLAGMGDPGCSRSTGLARLDKPGRSCAATRCRDSAIGRPRRDGGAAMNRNGTWSSNRSIEPSCWSERSRSGLRNTMSRTSCAGPRRHSRRTGPWSGRYSPRPPAAVCTRRVRSWSAPRRCFAGASLVSCELCTNRAEPGAERV